MYSRTFDPDLCNQLSRLLNIIVLHFENTLFFLVSSNIRDYIPTFTDNAIGLESFSLTLVLHRMCVKADQLMLSQPGGYIIPTQYYLPPPQIFRPSNGPVSDVLKQN